MAERANAAGPAFDAVVHNAAVGFREKRRVETEDGLPQRRGPVDDLLWRRRAWNGHQAYCDTKLHDTMLALAVARRWPGVLSNALEPGWMPTRMGGPRATGDLDAGSRTQAWLAAGDDPAAAVTGGYFHHLRPKEPSGAARDVDRQERLLAECARLSGVELPPG